MWNEIQVNSSRVSCFEKKREGGIRSNLSALFQVQDRRYREDVADFETGYGDRPVAAGQDFLGEQEIHEEALHGFQTPNTSHPRFRYVGGEKHGLGFVLVLGHHFLRVLGGGRAKPARRGGTTGLETAGTHLQRAQGQGGLLLRASPSRPSSRISVDRLFPKKINFFSYRSFLAILVRKANESISPTLANRKFDRECILYIYA